MVSRKSATKSKGRVTGKSAKSRNVKTRTGAKVNTKAKTPTRGVGKRQQKAAIKKPTTPVESSMSENTDTIEEVRASIDDVIDNAKKAVGVA